jgi:hypothetical protein
VSEGPAAVVRRGAARFALRDALLVLASAGLWWLDALARAQGQGGVAAVALAIAAALSAVGCGFLLHEWGHLAGALASGARVEFPDQLASLYLFRFDVAHNDRRQFLTMSYGGYLGSLVAAALLVMLLPTAALSGKIGLVLTAIGFVAGFAAELPITLRVLRGGPLPSAGPVYVRANQAP